MRELKPLQPLSAKDLYSLADRIGEAERKIFDSVFFAESKRKRGEETDQEKERKFARWRMARSKKVNAFGDKTYEDAHDYITKEELDFSLKKELQVPPEERYQKWKHQPSYHDSCWWKRGLEKPDGYGCIPTGGCIPTCRFYPETGRIEDAEIYEKYEKIIAERIRDGTLVKNPF